MDGDPIYDLYENGQVKDEEGKEFSKSINGIFQSTSAKSNAGIDALFENLGIDILTLILILMKKIVKKKKNMKRRKIKSPKENSTTTTI